MNDQPTQSVADHYKRREAMYTCSDRRIAESNHSDLPPAVRALFVENDVARAANFRKWLREI